MAQLAHAFREVSSFSSLAVPRVSVLIPIPLMICECNLTLFGADLSALERKHHAAEVTF